MYQIAYTVVTDTCPHCCGTGVETSIIEISRTEMMKFLRQTVAGISEEAEILNVNGMGLGHDPTIRFALSKPLIRKESPE